MDKSGKIDEQELLESFQLLDVRISAGELSKMMAELDDDGNGLLDFNEYVMVGDMIVSGHKALKP